VFRLGVDDALARLAGGGINDERAELEIDVVPEPVKFLGCDLNLFSSGVWL
jgi:hypothetical protein